MSERNYPDPAITLESETYWQGANQGKLMLKRCEACGETHFYPRAICPLCLSGETVWYEASGRGRIYSFSVTRRSDPPFAIAYVTLDEGVTMLTNIVDADLDALRIDMPVQVTFRNSDNGQALPLFRPSEG